jgi:hypothetical protein
MLCVYALLVLIFDGVNTYESLDKALAAKRAGLPDTDRNQTVAIALRISTFADGFKDYVVSHFSHLESHLPLLVTVLSTYVVFFNICSTLAFFSIPSHEMRRVIGPLSDKDIPPSIPIERVFVTSVIVTFVVVFIYLPIFAKTEAWVKGHPEVLETIGVVEKQVETIDGVIYKPGTIKQIELAQAVVLGKLNVSHATMEGQVDRAFDRMEQNVDGYLNWYYSLPAEYMRLATLLTGQIEGYMEQKLSEHLQQGDTYKILTDGVRTAEAAYKSVVDECNVSTK